MLSLLSAWIGLVTFLLAAGMVVHRPMMTDLAVTVVLWLGSPGSMCLAGLVLWAYRKEPGDPAIHGQRVQAKVAIVMSILAAALVYILIIYSQKLVPVEGAAGRF